MLELIGIACLALIVGIATWRITKPYCDRRVAESQRAIAAGGILIGWDFIAGPIVGPPEIVFPPDVAKRWREAAKQQAAEAGEGNGRG